MALSLVFNPISGVFDYVDSGNAVWGSPVATLADLQMITTDPPWTVRVVESVESAYVWNGSAWIFMNLVVSAPAGSTPNPDGYSIDAANTLTLQPGDATNPGILSNTAQTISGDKTITGNSVFSNNISTPGIFDPFGPAIDLTTGRATDSSGVPKINWVNGDLTDTANDVQINWTTSGVALPQLTANTVPYLNGSQILTSSAVTPTQLSYVDATSSIQTQLNAKVNNSEVGAANGVASLDSSGKIPAAQLPSTVFEYQGAWDPTTNTPTLTDLTGTTGYVYRVDAEAAGPIIGLSDPSMINFQVGNLIIYSGTAWQQVASADGVVSVNGAQGSVIVNAINQLTGDVAAGPATQSQSVASTIQPNVVTNSKLAQMTAATVKANTTGATANASDVALGTVTEAVSAVLTLTGWTHATIGSPTIEVTESSTASSGFLTSSDWNTFNNKQNALTLGNLTDAGTDGIVVTGGTNAVVGSGTSIAQAQASASQNGYLSSTDWSTFNGKPIPNAGDINPSTFAITNNQASATNVTGLVFTTHMAQVTYSVAISASSNLYEAGTILLCNMNGSWQITQQTVGNSSGIIFTVTNAGQIQYKSNNYTGFTAGTIYFRAITL